MDATLLNSTGVAGTSNWPVWLIQADIPVKKGDRINLPPGEYDFFALDAKGQLHLTNCLSRRIIINDATTLDSKGQSAQLTANSVVLLKIGSGTISLRVNSL